ncbi:MAG: ATP-binding protein [Desulfitobacteriia bacterium]|jgi:two-component system, sporulation sensor kinase E
MNVEVNAPQKICYLGSNYRNDLFRKVFNASYSMMAIKSLDGRYIDVNRSWLRRTGYFIEEVRGKLEEDINLWPDQKSREAIQKRLENGSIHNLQVEFQTKEGLRRIGLLSVEEIEIKCERFYLEAITDITTQRELEQEITKLDRLNSIAQIAAGISHEFRNPITTVRGFIQLLCERKDLAGIKEYFDIMLEEIDRANSIVTEFLTLSQTKTLDLRQNNVNICINKLFPMIQAAAFNEDKDLVLELNTVPDIYMDEGEIRQLILNLTRNALEASASGDKVTIKTFAEGDQVVLAIKDQGKGIEQETLGKLGTPFFTTKDNGTGMGLVICYRIAERHNAEIKIDTGTNGTTFYVRFKALNDN